ncbi:hypothetical protein J2T57_002608 [Natronocella acetinitrilica]|uniref:Uncharacterized protein n=1 Tax=Natronocella acetinitrilica TaxID=414046 RepID=A0AAE3G5E9_9GAMM|nr:hypothetical protein [Natronocella acetinitrilica]MCP1675458.1 hypothetical protein [Natronocella acetinitrilica]
MSDFIENIGFGIAVAGLCALFYQSYLWLQQGYWIPISNDEVFLYFDITFSWPYTAENWHGVASVMRWLLDQQFSFTAVFGGGSLVVICAAFESLSEINR